MIRAAMRVPFAKRAEVVPQVERMNSSRNHHVFIPSVSKALHLYSPQVLQKTSKTDRSKALESLPKIQSIHALRVGQRTNLAA